MPKATPTQTEANPSTEPKTGTTPEGYPAPDAVATPAADGPRVLNDDERIALQQKRALEERSGELATKSKQATARANALEGELTKERGLREAAEQQVVQLTAELARATSAAKNAGAQLNDLPSGAFQLNESVTLGSYGRRAQAKQGDVVLVAKGDEQVAELQQALGLAYTVYRVTDREAQELKAGGFLHGG